MFLCHFYNGKYHQRLSVNISEQSSSKIGSTVKGKTLLLWEQILPLKSRIPVKMAKKILAEMLS